MAREWGEAETLALLEERLSLIAPDNVADVPIASSKERQEDGTYVWGVHVHVKVKFVTEYDIEAYAHTYAGALRRAYLGLNNEANLRRHAASANEQFGIAV